ncbi:MAG: hypothetical protein GEU71_06845 [Actinobacteria bacterium]|nr:hypothetical protein [Actinomycetota bacterium]
MRSKLVLLGLLLTLGLAACSKTTTPHAIPSNDVSDDPLELADCEGLEVPGNQEIDTNLNEQDGILEFSYFDSDAQEDLRFRIAYEDPACEENPDTKRLIDHVLGVSSSTTPEAEDGTVYVFFMAKDALLPYEKSAYVATERPGPNDATTEERLRTALAELVRGPTSKERSEGLQSTFSDKTARLLNNVEVVGGRASVDFRDFRKVIPEVSTSHAGVAFQFALNFTVFQFGEIKQVEYSIEGSCKRYREFRQAEVCQPPRTRESWDKID